MSTSFTAQTPPPVQSAPWGALLERCYAKRGLVLPGLERLDEQDVPQPYKRLLVHSSDMTPTLEGFYQQRLGIKVLERELHEQSYEREVLLTVPTRASPVAYGAICIFLKYLPPAARRCVLEEQRPLGNILLGEGVPHLSWPQAFFRVESDRHMRSVLGLQRSCDLYGRRNVLLDGSRHLIADVIEILGPVEDHTPL
jgi:hypothetical protein